MHNSNGHVVRNKYMHLRKGIVIMMRCVLGLALMVSMASYSAGQSMPAGNGHGEWTPTTGHGTIYGQVKEILGLDGGTYNYDVPRTAAQAAIAAANAKQAILCPVLNEIESLLNPNLAKWSGNEGEDKRQFFYMTFIAIWVSSQGSSRDAWLTRLNELDGELSTLVDDRSACFAAYTNPMTQGFMNSMNYFACDSLRIIGSATDIKNQATDDKDTVDSLYQQANALKAAIEAWGN
jgi:hypothetical protein